MQNERNGRIRWLTGEYAGRTWTLPEGKTCWIGSSGDCEIPLLGENIASYHLGIICIGKRGGFYVLCTEPDSVFGEDGTPFLAGRKQWIPSWTVLILGDGSNRICLESDQQEDRTGVERKTPDCNPNRESQKGRKNAPAKGKQESMPHRNILSKIVLAAGIVCAIALIVTGIWKSGLLNRDEGNGTSLTDLAKETQGEDTKTKAVETENEENVENSDIVNGELSGAESQNGVTVSYSDGNTLYQPSENEVAFDHEACALYYQNLLDVYLWEEISEQEKKELAESVGGTIVGDVSGTINLLQIQVDAQELDTLLELANQLKKSQFVQYASYDFPMDIADTAQDQNPWEGETDKGNEEQPAGNDWWAEAIGAYTAWEYADEADTTFVLAGEVDSGFLPEHEEFMEDPFGSKLTFLADFPEHPVESTNDSGEIEYNSHGTHVAGIIAANNNDKGIRGIADQADILCIDWGVLDAKNRERQSQDGQSQDWQSQGVLTEIYEQMIKQGARAINNSWSGPIYSQETYEREHRQEYDNATWEEYCAYITGDLPDETAMSCICIIAQLAINTEKSEDFLIVASAGNGYDNNLSTPGYDLNVCGAYFAAINEKRFYDNKYLSSEDREKWEEKGVTYDTIREHLMIVSAVEKPENADGTYYLAPWASFGSNVDIAAPGIDILSAVAVSQDSYGGLSGTSMAAPMVTGAATLLWSLHPDWSAAMVKEQLLSNAGTAYGTNTEDMGQEYKMLNIGAAVITSADHGGINEQETSSVITVVVDAKDALQNYLEGVLVPQYGVMDTGYITGNYTNGGGDNWTSSDVNGLLSGNILDFDGDGQEELLTVRFEPGDQSDGRGEYLILQMYEYRPDSDSVELSAEKRMEISGPCYSGNGIGYSQTGIFTYTYLGDTYIAVDGYRYANGAEQTLSVFQYGGTGVIFDVVVPHTGVMEKSDSKVQRDGTSFEYICGANYYFAGEGDYYVQAVYTEPVNPLFSEPGDLWYTLMEYQAFYTPSGSNVAQANEPISETQKAEIMDCYRQRIEDIGLYAKDSRIGMAENSGMPTDESVNTHTTTPGVYTVQEGSITFLAGLYTYAPSTEAYGQITLERQDYEKTLDAFRTKKTQTEEMSAVGTEAPAGMGASDGTLPLDQPVELYFSSGAGGWYTEITLQADGSFTGEYIDGELGSTGDGYPNGTCYVSNFSGQFRNITQLDGTSWSMKLSQGDLVLQQAQGEQWIEDGTLYIASRPSGLYNQDEETQSFVFFTYQAPVTEMNEDFMSWKFGYGDEWRSMENLGCYALWETTGNLGFFGGSVS